MRMLGNGYGRIVKQVYRTTTMCRVGVPGVFCETPLSSLEEDTFAKAPVFDTLRTREELGEAENLVFHRSGAKHNSVCACVKHRSQFASIPTVPNLSRSD
uniref:Uncharacterized protein n=1 Tax=Steinernema glaseri TaxID=37863 RepID=A0A1I8A3T6_9BILA